MAYTLKKSNGATLLLLNDGLVDTAATSITLVGKNVSNFGDAQNENFLHLLENFAYSFQPTSPLQGQLWFDTSSNVFRPAVFDGNNWRALAVLQYSNTTTDILVNASGNNFVASQPGDMWFNSTSKQLYVITSTATDKILIGPELVQGFGTTKMSSVKMLDTLGGSHPVIQMVLDGEVIGVVSSSSFISATSNNVSGFSTINRGITLTTASTGAIVFSDTVSGNIVTAGTLNGTTANITTLIAGTANATTVNATTVNGTTVASTVGNFAAVTATTMSGTLINAGTLATPKLSAGSTASSASIIGQWTLGLGSIFAPTADLTNDLGTETDRFSTVYSRTLSTGASNRAYSGYLTGFWQLTPGSTVAPQTDLGNSLGAPGHRFNTVYASNFSAQSDLTTIGVTGSPSVAGNITPSVDNNYNLGSMSYTWANVYANNIQSNSLTSNIRSAVSTITNLTVTAGTIASLGSDNATVGTLSVTTATVSTLNSTNASASSLSATVATINTLRDSANTPISKFDTDGTLAADSDERLPTQKAVKTYVDLLGSTLQSEINAISTNGFGNNQTYVNVTGSRNFGTPYTNDTGAVIWVSATVSSPDLDWDESYIWSIAYVNGGEIVRQSAQQGGPGWMNLQFFVPPNGTYYINIYCPDEPVNNLSYGQSIDNWVEYR